MNLIIVGPSNDLLLTVNIIWAVSLRPTIFTNLMLMCPHSLFCFCNPPTMIPKGHPVYPLPVLLWCLVSSLVSRVLTCFCNEGSDYQEKICETTNADKYAHLLSVLVLNKWFCVFNTELLFCLKLKLLPLFIFYSGFKLNFSHWLLSSPSLDLTDDSAAWWEPTPWPLIPLVALLTR